MVDPRLAQTKNWDNCLLDITGVDAGLDFGEWECRLSLEGDVGSMRFDVGAIDVGIEFVDVWGKVELTVGMNADVNGFISRLT